MRVGADRITPINVRIIAASNTELIEEVNAGRFREDLFFRLNVLYIRIPPLRERIDDLPLLAEKFIAEICRKYKKKQLVIPQANMQRLNDHNWPGNVRQLQNFLERLILIVDNEFESVVFDELFDELFEYRAGPVKSMPQTIPKPSPMPAPETIGRTEQEMIQQALNSTGYHKTKTAEKLGISRTTLWKKMKKYGM
jgi:transcriptional regulator with PAS, ATPase and Fis domain